jgi:hypothetical protein
LPSSYAATAVSRVGVIRPIGIGTLKNLRVGILVASAAMAASCVFAMTAQAATCPAEQFGAAVDQSGAALRAFNFEAQPKLKERLKDLKAKKGWADEGYEDKAYEYLQDAKIAELDTRSNELLGKIDTLGRQGETAGGDCAALDELKAAGGELLGVMKAKSSYMLARIDSETGTAVAAATPDVAPALTPEPPKATPAPEKPAPAAKPDAQPSAGPDSKPWSTKTTAAAPPPVAVAPPAPAASDAYVAPPRVPEPMPPQSATSDEAGYTIEEIRDATKGFFGTVSTNLATVLEHAFSVSGRPTAYVLGQEGGGAFLAGLRYGDGTLFMRSGGTQKVYWHGPSIGADLGASGSRTLFLIYKMQQPGDLYRSFTGIDGSAYFVGGVGVTLMKGGQVVMAPIRSGLGLRLGANVGYVRFTPRATWNPF